MCTKAHKALNYIKNIWSVLHVISKYFGQQEEATKAFQPIG